MKLAKLLTFLLIIAEVWSKEKFKYKGTRDYKETEVTLIHLCTYYLLIKKYKKSFKLPRI